MAKKEAISAIRPDLNGQQIMEILEISPGPVVGRAYKHMLEIRMEHGPLSYDEARLQLLKWWETAESGIHTEQNP